MRDALGIYNIYKSNTISVIENNIYRVIDDVDDINFTKVDSIFTSLNDDKYNINRISALILFIMKELSFKTGDIYLSYSNIYNGVSNYLKEELSSSLFEDALCMLEEELKIKVEDDRYYIYSDYMDEDYIVNKLNYLINKDTTKYKNIDLRIKELEDKYEIKYSEKQKEAIVKA